MKTDLFQSCGHFWVFQIFLHIECSTFIASSSRIWNSSTGIPSPPLALFVMMLYKTHLTSHSRMSGSRWVITPWWLSRSWRSFLYSSSVYSCHLFLISAEDIKKRWQLQLFFYYQQQQALPGWANVVKEKIQLSPWMLPGVRLSLVTHTVFTLNQTCKIFSFTISFNTYRNSNL